MREDITEVYDEMLSLAEDYGCRQLSNKFQEDLRWRTELADALRNENYEELEDLFSEYDRSDMDNELENVKSELEEDERKSIGTFGN